jgi:hypothetical protein
MNETFRKIPLTIGVTGHLNPRAEDLETLRGTVKRELEKIRDSVPHTPLVMLCALARGADLLCADVAEELEISVRAVLPLEPEVYGQEFSKEDRARFYHHLERAETVFTAPAAEDEPEEDNRDFRYRQAGIYLAEHSHILLALWDGRTEGQSSCGTAAVMEAALTGWRQPRKGMACRNPENLSILHIKTPRAGDEANDAGEVRWIGNAEARDEILARTDEFNRYAEEVTGDDELLLQAEEKEPEIRKMEAVYCAADSLSIRFAKIYRRTLSTLAVLGTVVMFTFLLYDEAEMIPMMLACGAALLLAILVTREAKRFASHRRYIEYRTLAEALRVQLFLHYAGSRTEAQHLMTWTQQRETPWILCAVCAVNAEKPPEKIRDIRGCWVENQRTYHEKAGRRTAAQCGRNDRLLRLTAVCAVLLYCGGVLFELLCGGLILTPAVQVQNPGFWRTLLKILLGTVSAGALFLASYYGKMSLERKRTDHVKMEAFFRTIDRQMEQWGQTEELLETLAREELTENGNWCSYQRDNAPELNL